MLDSAAGPPPGAFFFTRTGARFAQKQRAGAVISRPANLRFCLPFVNLCAASACEQAKNPEFSAVELLRTSCDMLCNADAT
jgi:hypothetical protein